MFMMLSFFALCLCAFVAKQKTVFERMTDAKTEGKYLPLSSLVFMPELYRWRDADELSETQLESLIISLTAHGQQEAVEYTVVNGKNVLIKGHRRCAAFKIMAANQVPGIAADPLILVQEVTGANDIDLMVRSIEDNVVRSGVTEFHKVSFALKMRSLGAPKERVMAGIGVSNTTLDRYWRLGDNKWMLEHVILNHLRLSDAYKFLDAALNNQKVPLLQADLKTQITRVQAEIDAREAASLEATNKSLTDSEKQVKNNIASHELESWHAAVKRGTSFSQGSAWVYPAVITENKTTGVSTLKLPLVTLPLTLNELQRVRIVSERLARINRDLRSHFSRLKAEDDIKKQQAERDAEEMDLPPSMFDPKPYTGEPASFQKRISPDPVPVPLQPPVADPEFDRVETRELADPIADVEIPDAPPASGSEQVES
jgi:ParB-like chromosome segregation protein Spo0J